MLISANFAMLDGLSTQMRSTIAEVETSMVNWSGAANAASATWLDSAGGEFLTVHQRWVELTTLQNTMLGTLDAATIEARLNYEAAVRNGTITMTNVQL